MSSKWSKSCERVGKLKKGPWTYEEDIRLLRYITIHGPGRWSALAKASGLQRCGKSCRLRWVNYLRPDLKRGSITPEEERIILDLHARWGNRWSLIAEKMPGRTDNEIKNYWRSHMRKKLSASHDSADSCEVNNITTSLPQLVTASHAVMANQALPPLTSSSSTEDNTENNLCINPQPNLPASHLLESAINGNSLSCTDCSWEKQSGEELIFRATHADAANTALVSLKGEQGEQDGLASCRLLDQDSFSAILCQLYSTIPGGGGGGDKATTMSAVAANSAYSSYNYDCDPTVLDISGLWNLG